MSRNKGFTLIELLVVIAIIGILAAVVLASLNSARDSANDAAVKSQLANMRAQAEIFYTQAPGYYATADVVATDCADDTGGASAPSILTDGETGSIRDLIDGVNANNGGSDAICSVQTDQWAVSSALSDGTTFCVDSSGATGTADAAGGVCP